MWKALAIPMAPRPSILSASQMILSSSVLSLSLPEKLCFRMICLTLSILSSG